jgi:hypothetical protein
MGGVGELVLELGIRDLLPVLMQEVGSQALRHAARNLAERPDRGARQRFDGVPAGLADGPEARTPPSSEERTRIISHVPGRVRIQILGPRRRLHRPGDLTQALRACPGVQSVSVNPLISTALVLYDPATNPLARIRSICAMAFDSALGDRPRGTREHRAPVVAVARAPIGV